MEPKFVETVPFPRFSDFDFIRTFCWFDGVFPQVLEDILRVAGELSLLILSYPPKTPDKHFSFTESPNTHTHTADHSS